MMNRVKVLRRRDATLFHVPFYPESVQGLHVRTKLRMTGNHTAVVESNTNWSCWLWKMVQAGLIFQTSDSHYARPRTPADLEHRYYRHRKTKTPIKDMLRAQRRALGL